MPKRTVMFPVDGKEVAVPELSWAVLEDVVFPIFEDIRARRLAGMEQPWWKSRADDIKILAAGMGRPLDEVRAALSADEAAEASRRMRQLLELSGFTFGEPVGEDEASGSTETSTGSSPDSSPESSPE